MKGLRIFFVAWFCFGMIACPWAQTDLDSLRQRLQVDLPDSARFDLLIELASRNTHSHPDTTLLYTQQALVLAERIGEPDRLAVAYNRLGAGYWSTGELRQGLTYFQRSHEAAKASDDRYLMARNLGNIGLIYSTSGNYQAAISYYHEALPHFRVLANEERLAVTFNNLGRAFMLTERYDSAEHYLLKAQALAHEARPNILPILVFNLADTYFRDEQFEAAKEALTSCLAHTAQYSSLRGLIRANQLLAEIDLRERRLDSALVRARRAVSLAETSTIKELRYITYETLARALAAQGQYPEAYRYHERYASYKDSIRNLQTQNRLDFFDYEKKQQEIAYLRQERAYEQVQAERRRIVIGGLVVGLLLTSLLGVAFYRNQQLTKRANHLLHQKNHEIQQQKEAITAQAEQLTELNLVKDRLFSIISHDLRSPLRNLTELMDMTQDNSLPPEQLRAFLPRLSEKVGQTTDLLDNLLVWAESQMDGVKVHRRNFDLCALAARKLSFFQSMAERKQIRLEQRLGCDVEVFADQNMIEIVLQNLMANAIKFSHPQGRIVVAVASQEHKAVLQVRDTGVGIHPDNLERLFRGEGFSTPGTQQEKGTGLGLALCKEFVEKNGGRIWVESTVGEGSTFSFSLPLMRLPQ